MHSENADTPAQSLLPKSLRWTGKLARRKRLLVVGGLALLAAAPLVHGWQPELLVVNLVGLGLGLMVVRRLVLNHRRTQFNRQWSALNRQNLQLRQQELAERQERLDRRRQRRTQQETPA